MKRYILQEYKLPDNLEILQEDISNSQVQPYWMSEDELKKIDRLISLCKKKQVLVSRSAIIRDVVRNLNAIYRENPISSNMQHRQTFKIPKGTKEKIGEFLQSGSLTYELSSFITDVYTPSDDFPLPPQEHEDLNFRTDIEVFEKLDEIALRKGIKKTGRSKVFRDATNQFLVFLQKSQPKKTAIKEELKHLLEEYKTMEEPAVIKEEIEKYLN